MTKTENIRGIQTLSFFIECAIAQASCKLSKMKPNENCLSARFPVNFPIRILTSSDYNVISLSQIMS